MIELTEIDSLCANLEIRIRANDRLIIGIEGHPLSGKTTLARDHLSSRLNATHVGTDKYVVRGRDADTYLAYLDIPILSADMQAARAQGPVIVEGICLRDTLREIDTSADVFIYCKRITEAGLWADDPEIYAEESMLRALMEFADRQSWDYHSRAQPAEHADIVFLRREE